MSVTDAERHIIRELRALKHEDQVETVEHESGQFCMLIDRIIDDGLIDRALVHQVIINTCAKLCVSSTLRVYTKTKPKMFDTVEGMRELENELFTLAKCIAHAVQEQTAETMQGVVDHAYLRAKYEEDLRKLHKK